MEPDSARRARRLRDLRAGLWTGRCRRLLRTSSRSTRRDERRPHLLDLGPAQLFGQLHNRSRRPPGSAGAAFLSGGVRRNFSPEPVGAGTAGPRIHLPGKEIRFVGECVAAPETLALARPRALDHQTADCFYVADGGITHVLQGSNRVVGRLFVSKAASILHKDRPEAKIRALTARRINPDLKRYAADDEAANSAIAQCHFQISAFKGRHRYLVDNAFALTRR